jgi:hypothetical protein
VRLNQVRSCEIDRWLEERHYLQSVPAGAVIRLEFFGDNGQRVGAMMWGRPISPKVDQQNILELTRMYFIDDAGHCAESRALGMARKHIRKHYPHIHGLIAYSSTGERHRGTIYLADGWFLIGKSRSPDGSWANRPGRQDRDLSEKLKFARSP